MNQNYISMLKIKYLILLLFLLVYPIQGQKLLTSAEKLPDYEYDLGKGVGYALWRNCSASLAKIEKVKATQSPVYPNNDEINVKLSVIEYYRFTKNRKEGEPEIEISYLKARAVRRIPTYDPFKWHDYVNMIEGNKAMVFYCKDSSKASGYLFVTTDAANFDKIKQAIELTEQFRIDSNKILDYFANDFKSDNEIIKGAAINFLYGSTSLFGDIGAYILVNLLNETPISKQRDGWMGESQIGWRLNSDDLADKLPEFRKQAFIKLVQIASGENENAIGAARILANIAPGNSGELRPYLKAGKTEKIRINLLKVNMTGDGWHPESLVKLLSEQ